MKAKQRFCLQPLAHMRQEAAQARSQPCSFFTTLDIERGLRTDFDVDVDTGITRVDNTGAAALPLPAGSFAPLRVALVEGFLQFLNFACSSSASIPSARQGFHHT